MCKTLIKLASAKEMYRSVILTEEFPLAMRMKLHSKPASYAASDFKSISVKIFKNELLIIKQLLDSS